MNCNNHIKNNSLYHKNFNLHDVFLKLLLNFSFVLTIGFFICFIGYIFYHGLLHVNPKLIYNVVDGVQKGILPIIINTIYVEVITLLIATPIGIGSAIYITQYAKNKKIIDFINFSINILASIPSVLFGLFGYNVFCVALGLKPSILVGCLTLTCCILPNIVETSKEAILAVPNSYKQAAFALGAGKFNVITHLILPSAMPGIVTSIILSAGKIMGESAALLLTIGTASKMPSNLLGHIFKTGKTLTLDLYYTAGNSTKHDSINICFAIATLLIFLIFSLNCLTRIFSNIFKNKLPKNK